ncbi:hypothetical protein SDC9_139593 [bioreactor metagenome]|uniref:Uncharacterized protein n=1 Tax=bioreactor metagenome TaxID=1076179 RepID=A0A645DTI9_9ZZZZ
MVAAACTDHQNIPSYEFLCKIHSIPVLGAISQGRAICQGCNTFDLALAYYLNQRIKAVAQCIEHSFGREAGYSLLLHFRNLWLYFPMPLLEILYSKIYQ